MLSVSVIHVLQQSQLLHLASKLGGPMLGKPVRWTHARKRHCDCCGGNGLCRHRGVRYRGVCQHLHEVVDVQDLLSMNSPHAHQEQFRQGDTSMKLHIAEPAVAQ